MLKLVKYLKKYRKNVILGPIFKLTEAVFELIVPLVMAKIIDIGIAHKDSGYIWKMGGVLVLLGVCGLGFALICQYVASVASQGFGTELRRELYHHINTLSHKEVDEFGTPSLITRLTSDINQLQVAVAMLIRLVVRAPFLVIGSTIMAFMIDVKLALIFVLVIPLVAIVMWLVTTRTIPFFKSIQKKLDSPPRQIPPTITIASNVIPRRMIPTEGITRKIPAIRCRRTEISRRILKTPAIFWSVRRLLICRLAGICRRELGSRRR